MFGITIPFIFTVLLYIFSPKPVPALVIITGVIFTGISAPYYVSAFLTLRSGKEFAAYITAVLNFSDSKISYECPSNFAQFIVSHFKLVSLENKRLFSRNSNVDIVGLVTANNVLYCSTTNHAVIPIFLYLKLDPLHHLLENLTSLNDEKTNSLCIRLALFIVRFCVISLEILN